MLFTLLTLAFCLILPSRLLVWLLAFKWIEARLGTLWTLSQTCSSLTILFTAIRYLRVQCYFRPSLYGKIRVSTPLPIISRRVDGKLVGGWSRRHPSRHRPLCYSPCLSISDLWKSKRPWLNSTDAIGSYPRFLPPPSSPRRSGNRDRFE